MNKILLSITMATLLISCSRKESPFFVDKINPKRAELKIITKHFQGKTPRWKEYFQEGDEIGIYLLAGQNARFQTDSVRYRNVRAKAVKQADGELRWIMNPTIYLDTRPVTLFAYFPFRPQGIDLDHKLPLAVQAQNQHTPFYRYGRTTGKQKRLNCRAPIAHIIFKPALARLAFRVKRQKKDTKDVHLQAIQLQNSADYTLHSHHALLELNTGRITPLPSPRQATRLTVGKLPLDTNGYKECSIWVLPTFRQAGKGDIKLLCTIEQRTYIASFPPHTQWDKGYEYVYEIIFDGKACTLKPAGRNVL